MIEKSPSNTALLGLAALVFAAGCTSWVFPDATASAVGDWMLPALSFAGVALTLVLARDWRWLRRFLAVLITTLVAGWIRAPGSAPTARQHFAGVSLGLLLMLIVGRVVHTEQRLRLAMFAFLSGGLFVLVLAISGTDLPRSTGLDSIVLRKLPTVRLGLAGLERNGYVNVNAVAAAALLIAPLGVSVLFLRTHKKVDVFGLQPLGLLVVVAAMLVLAVSRSRSAGIAVWLTLVGLLVRGQRWWPSRLLIGTAVVALPFVAIGSMLFITSEEFLLKARDFRSTAHDRAHIIRSGVEQWRKSPWLGIGLNQFRYVYKPPNLTPEYDVAHAHNVFLQTALDTGVFGLGAYCGVLGFLLTRACQATRGPSNVSRVAAVGAGLSLVTVSVFGFADAVALGAKVGLFQWMAGGLILGSWRTQLRSRQGHHKARTGGYQNRALETS